MAGRRESSSKPSGKSQASALVGARDVVVKLREEGKSLQEITDRLAVQGVRVNRNAVDRFCKKHGILAGQALSAAKADDPESIKYESFPEVIVPKQSFPQVPSVPATKLRQSVEKIHKPVGEAPQERCHESVRAVEPLSTVTEPSPETASAPKPAATPVIGVLPEQNAVRIDLGPPSTVAAYSVAVSVPEVPTIMSPARDGVTDDQMAIAKVLAGLGPRIESINAAHREGDFDATADAMREAVAWLDSVSADVPEYVRELARKAIRETEAMLASARRQIPLAPETEYLGTLFTPLPPSAMWTPDVCLIGFGATPNADRWTIQDACEGTLILGATGSGKTTGSGATVARAFLSAQFGGLVLTAKQDEARLWTRYAETTGRTGQLCVVRPGGPFRFNFLQYQAGLSPEHGGSTENIVESLYTLLEGFSRGGGQRGGEHGSFWANTARQLLRNLIRVLRTPGVEAALTLAAMRRFMSEAPQSLDEARSGEWKQSALFGATITSLQKVTGLSGAQQAEREESLRYWLNEFPGLNSKTRSIVVTDFTSMVDLFFDPTLGELFLSDTTITPEAAIQDGAVVVIDLPTEKYQAIGRLAQLVWKHFLQQAVKRRADADGPSRRPVFLWIDEFQSLLSEGDAAFQATARSARCATVLLTQNLPGLYAQAGATLPRERIDALAGNLATKFIHANSDPTTNQWAAEQIGKSMQYRVTVSSPDEPPLHRRGLMDRLLWPARARTSTSPTIDFEVQPSAFTKLRTGSQRYDFTVDAVMVKSGSRFSNGKHYLSVSFQQENTQP